MCDPPLGQLVNKVLRVLRLEAFPIFQVVIHDELSKIGVVSEPVRVDALAGRRLGVGRGGASV